MASAERWLFRMWQLSKLFIILILFVQQNVADQQTQDSHKQILVNVTAKPTPITVTEALVKIDPSVVTNVDINPNETDGTRALDGGAKPIDGGSVNIKGSAAPPDKPAKVSKSLISAPKQAEKSPSVVTTSTIPTAADPKPPPKETQTNVDSNAQFPGSNKPKTESKPVEKMTTLASTSKGSSGTPNKNLKSPDLTKSDANKKPPIQDEVDQNLLSNTALVNPEQTDNYDNEENTDDLTIPEKGEDAIVEPEADKPVSGKEDTDEPKPQIQFHPNHAIGSDEFGDADSHFFAYFLSVVGMCIIMYVLFHNKQKILALIVEGRQERRRRPNTSQYRPLDNNLEEVIQAGTPKNGRLTTNIIY